MTSEPRSSRHKPFTGSFTQQEAISEDAIAAAVEVLRSGRLHRYNTAGEEVSQTAQLEQEFAAYQGAKYCLACASGGYALHIALRAAGIEPGDPVLTNSFTLAPVPGAIANAGGKPVFVEVTRDLVLDLEDLEEKIALSGARFLMLSHMRGHLVDMEKVTEIGAANDVVLIEDCAHTMGAKWRGRRSGNFGLAGCFSTQTYKHMNSGEGGLLTSDAPDFMARAIIMSGSYMLYERHRARPDVSVFQDIRLDTPNCSGRMDNLRASILRPQLANLERNITRWNGRYHVLADALRETDAIYLPQRPAEEEFVASSFQFLIPGISDADARRFVASAKRMGVELKWFGDTEPAGFTSRHQSWRYVEAQSLPSSDAILAGLFDLRIPLTFSLEDMEQVGGIIAECANEIALEGAA